MNYLLAHKTFTKINHKPIDLHYKFNTFSIIYFLCFLSFHSQLPATYFNFYRLPSGYRESVSPAGSLYR